ncbi:MAG: hypothetical protein GY800_12210, partial [Planctomycetes bacterium]|nr:hypothetical protein [Planctomycetota bacterium]
MSNTEVFPLDDFSFSSGSSLSVEVTDATDEVKIPINIPYLTQQQHSWNLNIGPDITTQPSDVTIFEGQTATFSVTATGGSLNYQWQKDGDDIPGATSSSYTTPALAVADNGAQYRCVVSTTASHSTTSHSAAAFVMPLGTGGSGTITREWWTGIAGSHLADLMGSPNYPGNPTGANEPTSFEAPEDIMDNYGTRMHGYVHPPVTGNYTFWIASDDHSELWLSASEDVAQANLIASVTDWTTSRQWAKYPSQQSVSITLQAGNRYYIRALHKDRSGGDNLAVAWQGPYITQSVIDGVYLSPWDGGVSQASYPVAAGWNMISFNVTPDDPGVASVFSSLQGLVLVKDSDGKVYWPDLDILGIATVLDGQGYKLYTNSPGDITFTGTPIDVSTPINLAAGWNLAAYIPAGDLPIVTALAGIVADVNIVKNSIGDVYWPDLIINQIGDMVVGQAYKIHMKNAATLIYPGATAKVSAIAQREGSAYPSLEAMPFLTGSLMGAAPDGNSSGIPLKPGQPEHYLYSANTGRNATMLCRQVLLEGAPVPDHSEIGAYDSQGKLIGSGRIQEGKSAFSMWGDDFLTKEKDGATEGERVTFRLWSRGAEYSLALEDGKEAVYSSDAIIMGDLVASEKKSGAIAITGISPNPFQEQVKIGFELPAVAETNFSAVTVELISLKGERMAVVAERAFGAGRHVVNYRTKGKGL